MPILVSYLATLSFALTLVLAQSDSISFEASASVTSTSPADAPLGTAFNGPLDLDFDNPPEMISFSYDNETDDRVAEVARTGPQSVTIRVRNQMKTPVKMIYKTSLGSPPLKGNPQEGRIPPGGRASVVMPRNYAGQSTFGINAVDARGTKWEASLKADPNQGGKYVPFIDVSYVDGYSVPMTCSCNGKVATGCNKQLWNGKVKCGTKGPGPTCYNPLMRQPQTFPGPAAPFFRPCQGAAYTFPGDDEGTKGCPGAKEIHCCIGTSCPAPRKQKPNPRKRDSLRYAVRGDDLEE